MNKQQIICIAFPKWEGDYLKSTVQLMKSLSKDYEILYVDYTYTWLDIIRSFLGKKHIPVSRILGLRPRVTNFRIKENQNVKVLRLPPIIPCNWITNQTIYQMICTINGWFLLPTLKYVMFKHGFRDPLIVNAFQPWLGTFLKGKLGQGKSIYYCYDEISAAPWISRHGDATERKFLEKADHTIVTSTQLYKTKSKFNSNISIVKNGVDTDVFSIQKPTIDVNQEKERTSYHRVIGYLGSIDERLDEKLLTSLIAECKDCQFRFVGRVTDNSIKNSLVKFSNVEFTGPVPPSELPFQVDRMDVCMIPFKVNPLTAGIYPLKINEYLLRGKPVVSTPFADLSDFKELIHIGNDNDAFKAGIMQFLKEGSIPAEIAKRKEFALGNGWDSRAKELKQIFNRLAS